MSLLPISPVTTLTAAGTALGTAGGAVAGTFGRLLGAALGTARVQPARIAADPPRSSPPGSSTRGIEPPATDLAGVRHRVATLKTKFLARFRELLAEHGIENAGAIQLALDDFGDLRVVGASAQSAEIEHVLMTTPDLAQTFRDLAAASRLLETAVKAASFKQNTAAGLDLETDTFPHLFSTGTTSRFVLTVTADAAEGLFIA